jgi:hypothetical protein
MSFVIAAAILSGLGIGLRAGVVLLVAATMVATGSTAVLTATFSDMGFGGVLWTTIVVAIAFQISAVCAMAIRHSWLGVHKPGAEPQSAPATAHSGAVDSASR